MRWIMTLAVLIPACAAAQGMFLTDYPSNAAAHDEHGSVRITLVVEADGRVDACKVGKPSGVASLDAAICDIVRRRRTPAVTGAGAMDVMAHFITPTQAITPADLPIGPHDLVLLFSPGRAAARDQPTMVGPGKAQRPERLPPIGRPKFPVAALGDKFQGATSITILVSTSGRPNGCHVVRTSGRADLDAATCYYAIRNFRYVPGTDYYGNKIRDVDFFTLNWAVR
jgi:protein TonB